MALASITSTRMTSARATRPRSARNWLRDLDQALPPTRFVEVCRSDPVPLFVYSASSLVSTDVNVIFSGALESTSSGGPDELQAQHRQPRGRHRHSHQPHERPARPGCAPHQLDVHGQGQERSRQFLCPQCGRHDQRSRHRHRLPGSVPGPLHDRLGVRLRNQRADQDLLGRRSDPELAAQPSAPPSKRPQT